MSPEIAIATPFDSNEVKSILTSEFRKRLDQLSPLQGGKEYAAFRAEYQVKIWVRRSGEPEPGRETLAWGNVSDVRKTLIAPKVVEPTDYSLARENDILVPGIDESLGEIPEWPDEESATLAESSFKSGEPNAERVDREMPLTIETGDGRGGKRTKKVRVAK